MLLNLIPLARKSTDPSVPDVSISVVLGRKTKGSVLELNGVLAVSMIHQGSPPLSARLIKTQRGLNSKFTQGPLVVPVPVYDPT